MQSFLDTIHSVYIFYSKKSPLSENGFWEKFVEILNPLIQFTKFQPDVKMAVYDSQSNDLIEYDDLGWSYQDLKKVTSGNNGDLQLDKLIFFCPSLRYCYENKMTPDIFFKISAKPTSKEKRYEISFMLAVKKDLLNKVSNEKFESILNDLQQLFAPVFKIKQERQWAIPVSEFQYTDEMQFFFPSILLDAGDQFMLKDEYQNWIEF